MLCPHPRVVGLPLTALLLSALVASCGGKSDAALGNDPLHAPAPAADLPELEIRSNGVDRFTTCPPPGDLGQHWIPTLPPWSPPPPSKNASGASGASGEDLLARTDDRTLTEIAIEATHRDFRGCYRQGLVHYPTQDGRVAIVLRIAPDGRVARVESYAACELAPESISCMYGVAQKLRFPPPTPGTETVTIPAVFTSRDGVRRTVPTTNDSYTAGAYLTLEGARAGLHACEEKARREGRAVQATGTFTMDIVADGRVVKSALDPANGDPTLLDCASHALSTLRFAPPDGGKGIVIARLNFNPRQGTR
jgi:hypothetical protein